MGRYGINIKCSTKEKHSASAADGASTHLAVDSSSKKARHAI